MTMGDIGRTAGKLAATGLLMLIVACEPGQSEVPGSSATRELVTSVSSSVPAPIPNLSPLDALTVAPDGPMTGYSRARFGVPWRDTDHNGCDQRNDVLTRDAGSAGHDERHRCIVNAISLVDPYSGERLTELGKIQIDHVVSLGAAWRAGAAGWTPAQRELFATDKRNLLAVKGKANQDKSDDPPEKFRHLIQPSSWCKVARIYVQVSGEYHLTITAPSRDALAEMLATCRDFP